MGSVAGDMGAVAGGRTIRFGSGAITSWISRPTAWRQKYTIVIMLHSSAAIKTRYEDYQYSHTINMVEYTVEYIEKCSGYMVNNIKRSIP